MWFVWVKGLRGPVPQIWHQQQIQGETGKPYPTLAKYVLGEGFEEFGIAGMVAMFPPPKEETHGPKINLQSEP